MYEGKSKYQNSLDMYEVFPGLLKEQRKCLPKSSFPFASWFPQRWCCYKFRCRYNSKMGHISSCSPLQTLEITKFIYRMYDTVRNIAQISWCPTQVSFIPYYTLLLPIHIIYAWSDLFLNELSNKAEYTL